MKIPGTEKIELKEKFVERYKELAGGRYDEFLEYSFSFMRRSFRVNTIKAGVAGIKERLAERWKLEQIPWCSEGFWIEGERRDIGATVEHSLGYIYVQEAASMIPAIVLAPEPDDVVLDMAASPGSKTTHLSAIMKNHGLVIANDIRAARLKPLGLNIQRCGCMNCVITLKYGQHIRRVAVDKVLLDAPCSGTGNIRRSLKTVWIWNPLMISRLAKTQRSLAANAFELLSEGGEMVYSTCSLEPEENEGVVDYLLSKYANAKLKSIDLNVKRSPPIEEFGGAQYSSEVKKCLRIWPQDNDTGGFFVARIAKT